MIVIKSRQEEQASRKTYSSRTTLYNEEDRDRLVRIMPGVFVEADASMSDINVMQWLTLRQPHSIMNLISALSFHQATTQIPQYLSAQRRQIAQGIGHACQGVVCHAVSAS